MMRWLPLIGVLAAAPLGAMTEYAAAMPPRGWVWDAVAWEAERQLPLSSRLFPIQHTTTQRDVPNAVGTAGQPIPLRVEIPAEFRNAQFLVIRGLPLELSLSAGFRVGAAWYVPFSELATLAVISPANFTGNFVFDATLFKELQGGSIGHIYITLAIRTPRVTGGNRANVGALSQAAPKQQDRPPVSAADEQDSLARGMSFMQRGDVASARLIFQALAQRGSSQGARAMGETYDPFVLSRIFIAGLRADLEEATRWYLLAAEMGDAEAERRLAALRSSP
jgi:hypothetical protein